jgi:colanic acid/amylovoran biosynthesis glycosyltransferase
VNQSGRYKVAHLRRTYLLRREPFIGYQVTSHVDFDPMVLCRERDFAGGYENVPIYCRRDHLKGFGRQMSDILYRSFRVLSRRELQYLEGVLQELKPDILHCHYLPDARFFLKLHRRNRIPLIVSAYGYDVSEFPRRLLGYGKRYLLPVLKEADIILAMSPDMDHDLQALGCPTDKIRIHYYGVETSAFQHPSRAYDAKGNFTLLMVAGLDEYKGHIYLLRALSELSRRQHSYKFTLRLVGDGPLKRKLKTFVREHDLEGNVEFVGFVPRQNGLLAQEYCKADVFVMPSVTQADGLKEGIPGALVEAMSSGLPCIATRHAGIPHVLTDGVDGLLVNERDVDGLLSALERLLNDRALRRTLGEAAARRALKEFDHRERICHLESIYKSLLHEN